MPAYQLIMIGMLIGMFFTITIIVTMSKKTEPDTERRAHGGDRRKRHNTRVAVRHIAAHHQDGALTTPQAVTRLKEIEAPTNLLGRSA